MEVHSRDYRDRARRIITETPEVREAVTAATQTFVDNREKAFTGLDTNALSRWAEGVKSHALRELGVEEQPLRLLESAGAGVVPWEMDQECCGFGGLFSVKAPEVSVAMADRKLDTLPDVETVVSADGGCLLQLDGRARRRRMPIRFRSLASVLWEARRGGA